MRKMEFGVRAPSIKKFLSARTTGHVKRAVKNSVYHKTTKNVWSLFK